MSFSLCRRSRLVWILLVLVVCFCSVKAQDDVTDGENDPVKLFERAQNAHAQKDLERALALYDAAIKLRPEFPEAEYQRGVALIALKRPAEAEKAFARAIELKKDWGLPYSALGNLLTRQSKDKEAEPLLRKSIQLGVKDYFTLDSLSTIRFRAGDKSEALRLARQATEDENASATSWAWRGSMEHLAGDSSAALNSLAQALKIDQRCLSALTERSEIYIEAGKYDPAIDDLKTALSIKSGDKEISLRLARAYQLANRPDEMRRVYESAGLADEPAQSNGAKTTNVTGTPEEISAANDDDPKIAEPALDNLIKKNPNNAALFGRLGEVTRRSDPAKSAESYRHANQIDPTSPKYATGYAAALIQQSRFAEAATILQNVISKSPDDYVAHANFALALYKLKHFAEAIREYEWLAAKRPEIAATYFFLATAHDNLGEYEEALAAYDKFLAHADAVNNRLDIERVNLRLPALREQIKRGQGVKRKKSD